ncbi:MAG: HDOD domain-containing protein [Firmicutes bacterium]|nr:HDOD domain-containing protein [Bacillota bacterium]
MKKFVVRQPIKDIGGNTVGYEILFNIDNGIYNNTNNDYMAADTISSFLLQNSDKVFSKGMTFITFTPNLLFKNTPKMFKNGDVVIQIEDNFTIHPLAPNVLQRYRDDGYNICVNNFQFVPRYFSLMEYIDYIKINVNLISDVSAIENMVQLGRGFNKKCIITGIDNKELYEKVKNIKADLFQGSFVAEATATKANKTEYLQSNFFQLVVASTKDIPDMAEIEGIISRDASLTYAILKMVNSVHFALRQRTSSVKQALVILGLTQLKQWIYLLSFESGSNDPKSEEVLKTSFLRANFCSELYSHVKGLPITQQDAYLIGMFSTMDTIVNAPIEEVMAELPVADEVKAALISQEGDCGTLYKLVLSYERADWKGIVTHAAELDMNTDSIAQIYFDCIEKVNEIWDSFMSTTGDELEEEIEKLEELDPLEQMAQFE